MSTTDLHPACPKCGNDDKVSVPWLHPELGAHYCEACKHYFGHITPSLPDDIIDRLNNLSYVPDCPACHSDLRAESDDRMDTGFAWACVNRDCPDGGGCWPVMKGDIRKACE